MFTDRRFRILSYHDTWMSIDPLRGCPFKCVYCVLRHAGTTGIRPQQVISPAKCVQLLLEHPLFIREKTYLAIGNETDALHSLNIDYLISLLEEMRNADIRNPISLITKAPLSHSILDRIRAVGPLTLIFFLSYSGLGKQFEPNFTDDQLRSNFALAKSHGFPVVHYWRPLLPDNSTPEAIRKMLSFASKEADASVFIGLKLHPELTKAITADGSIVVPAELRNEHGEWLEPATIKLIYSEAHRLCPTYPLYRHTSCALAKVLGHPNHTGTVFRRDICPPSHCPIHQRQICEGARSIPSESEIAAVLAALPRHFEFERKAGSVVIKGVVTQEEFSFLVHNLRCPIDAEAVRMQNLYQGSIYEQQRKI